MCNGYKINILLKGTLNSSIYYLCSIVYDNEWLVIAINEENNIFVLREIENTLTFLKSIRIPPHTNVKSINHLK